MRRMHALYVGIAIWSTFLALMSTALASDNQTSSNQAFFSSHYWESFQKLEAAQALIDREHLNTNLLSAAIFHETNRQRQLQRLPALLHNEKVLQAAALQALIMVGKADVTHDNPERPGFETLKDRLAKIRLQPRFAAENVASAFELQYQSGKSFYPRTENGRTIISYSPKGDPIPRHTYLSFASAVVDGWMNSPGHRRNILHPSPKYHGAAGYPAQENSQIPVYYCAQVFFTPLD